MSVLAQPIVDRASMAIDAFRAFQADRPDTARSGSSWTTTVLRHAEDVPSVPTCGLTCKVGDLYRGTPLDPGRVQSRA